MAMRLWTLLPLCVSGLVLVPFIAGIEEVTKQPEIENPGHAHFSSPSGPSQSPSFGPTPSQPVAMTLSGHSDSPASSLLHTSQPSNESKLQCGHASCPSPSSSVSSSAVSMASTSSSVSNEDSRGLSFTTATTQTTDLTTVIKANPGSTDPRGIVILIVIIMLIFILAAILFILRRHHKRYSFDLHRSTHDIRIPFVDTQHPGSFEAFHLAGASSVEDLSSTPSANGKATGAELTETSGNSVSNGLIGSTRTETPPLRSVRFSLDLDQTDKMSNKSSSSSSLCGISLEEQLKGSTDKPGVCSDEPFVEIQLEDSHPADSAMTPPSPPSPLPPPLPAPSPSSSSSSSNLQCH